MKKTTLLILFLLLSPIIAFSQTKKPFTGNTPNFSDTPETEEESSEEMTQPGEEKKKKNAKEEENITNENQTPLDLNNVTETPLDKKANLKAEKTKQEISLMKLSSEKIRVEQELLALQNKYKETPPTKEEKEILTIKTESLRLINLKEQIIIRDELDAIERKKKLKEFPSSEVEGHGVFRNDNFELYQTTSEVVATEGYVLGSGDVVQIELWGYKYWSKSYVVNEMGSIDIENYTNVFVKGLTLKNARSLVASRLGVNGTTSNMALSVTRPRMVSVNILGEVFNPGTFTLPATNSAFNFLVAMGGPTNAGSVRNIRIKRDGIIVDSFDLYEHESKTLHTRDVYLQNGDIIIVPGLSNTARIQGAIRRPGLYEIKNSDDINTAISIASGLLVNTFTKDIVVTRYYNNKYEVISVNLDSLNKANKTFLLKGVESITFKGIRTDFKDAVNIGGAVSVPGSYRISTKMRISGIIKNANGLLADAYQNKAYLIRTNFNTAKKEYVVFSPKNVVENPGSAEDVWVNSNDSIYIFRNIEITQSQDITIEGAVYKPTKINFISNLKLGDFIFMAGGFTPDYDGTRGYIVRTIEEFKKQIIPFTPSNLSLDSTTFNILISPKDIVRIYSREEQFKNYNVFISGAIVKGVNNIDFIKDMTAYDLILMSGGLTDFAFKQKAILVRTNLENNLKSTFVLNIDSILNNPLSKDNINLQKGDSLIILDQRKLFDNYYVYVSGGVRNPKRLEYTSEMRLNTVILESGGLVTSAFKNRAIVISKNLQTGQKTSKVVNLNIALNNPNSLDNVLIQPSDSIRIFDLAELKEDFKVTIRGGVRKEGTFEYFNNMTLQMLIDLAGGMKYFTAGSKMEIVRNFSIQQGDYIFAAPTLQTLNINKSFIVDSNYSNFYLQPFDAVFVRSNPNYKELKTVFITGAVKFPGAYALVDKNEKLRAILKRAGGFTFSAFPEGSVLTRTVGLDVVKISLNSGKAYRRKSSNHNCVLQDGDIVNIPLLQSIVFLSGDLNIKETSGVGTYYKPRKRAKYYIVNFGGGFTKTSDKKQVIVEHKNGVRAGTKVYWFFKVYPKVKMGSKIIVLTKPPVDAKSKFNSEKFLTNLITKATAILTLFSLYKIATAK